MQETLITWFKHADTASDQSIPTGSDGFMPETNLDENTDCDVLINMDNANEQEDLNTVHLIMTDLIK